MSENDRHFETRAIHDGQDPEPTVGAVNVPIFQTSTYAQPDVGMPLRYDYARGGNPTRDALQTVIASLEGGRHGYCFASGMAAESTLLLSTLAAGDHVVLGDDVYGGTYRLLKEVIGPWGVEFNTVDLGDPDTLRRVLRANTRLVWAETPTNPLLKIVDLAKVGALAHEGGARFVVDNTFATPYLQRPLSLGADVVVHSVTKYLGGHSDLVGGALVLDDDALAERIAFNVNAVGAVPGPMDCYLALRGVKTLAVRMQAHCRNAGAVARFLDRRSDVGRVFYPGLDDDPGHAIAARQMRGFGGMVSFEAADPEEATRIARTTELFLLAESLGGVESLIEVPAPMTHASVSGSSLEVPASLVRLSVGIEHVDDLIADLEQALG
ncbi:MAG: cystathionine gamma-synthase [Actinomycetota bacterium]